MIENFISKLLVLLLFSYVTGVNAQNFIVVEPEAGSKATISVNEKTVSFTVNSAKGIQEESFLVETEKSIHVSVGDYDFDGKKEFSVWYMDDGHGTYTLHRIFLFSPGIKKFIEIHPQCGDEFINLKVNRRKKNLTSTYFENNIAKLCVTFPRNCALQGKKVNH